MKQSWHRCIYFRNKDYDNAVTLWLAFFVLTIGSGSIVITYRRLIIRVCIHCIHNRKQINRVHDCHVCVYIDSIAVSTILPVYHRCVHAIYIHTHDGVNCGEKKGRIHMMPRINACLGHSMKTNSMEQIRQ